MKTLIKIITIVVFLNNNFTFTSYGCSVFCIDRKGNLVVGHSYDWNAYEKGYFMVNKRGHLKQAFYYWNQYQENLAVWTSKYGSITENQYGRDNCYGGMNEAGLVIYELWLDESVYPSTDERPYVFIDQYVQYLLDNYATVDEIIASDSIIRIRSHPDNFTRIHFYALDSSGNCLIIDFLEGKPVYHSHENAPVKAITNDTYEYSILEYYQTGGAEPASRFCRIAKMLDDSASIETDAIPYAFKILDTVRQGITLFQTVYDIKNRRIYTKSIQAGSKLRYFDFDNLDFNCNTVSKVLDLNIDTTGDVTGVFIDYTTEINEDLIIEGWERLGYSASFLPALHLISRYPETFECTGMDLRQTNERKDFNVYPNPAVNMLYFDTEYYKKKKLHYKLIDITGRVVIDNITSCNLMPLPAYLNGLYILEFCLDSESLIKKVLIH